MSKQKIIISLLMFFIYSGNILQSQDVTVVGFLPHYRFSVADQIDFSKLTHVNIAFANPDMEGNISFEGKNIDPIVEMAHTEYVEVFISMAGGYLIPEWDLAWIHLMKPENRSEFIHKIIQYCKVHDIQGIDMDLEWQYVTEAYSPFVLELKDSTFIHNLTLTASLPGTYRYPDITDETMFAFDWINMMVYDLTGPWAPASPGPHSPFSFAENSFFYWQQQGMSPENLSLGLPFYGYDFKDPTDTDALTYAQIVNMKESYAFLDQVGDIHYNGIPTIKKKTQFAIDENMKGVMMWELGQDHFSELSLLNAISEVINPIISTDKYRFEKLHIAPNPASDFILFHLEDQSFVRIYNNTGNLIYSEKHKVGESQIELAEFPSGLYHIMATSENSHLQSNFIKIK